MEFQLIEKRQEASDTTSFLFKPQNALQWKPGQYLHYVLDHPNPDDRGVERYFSISSAPFEKNVMLTTRFAPKGSSFKRALQEMRSGDTIKADGLEGDFVVDDPQPDTIFVAGGIGITPYRSILLDLDQRNLPINVLLLYANRNDDFPFRSELETVKKRHALFCIDYFVSPRRIDETAIRNSMKNLTDPTIYVSGPEPMVESFDTMLKQIGIPESRIKNDYFPGYDWP